MRRTDGRHRRLLVAVFGTTKYMDEGGASSSTCNPDYLGECEALSAQYLGTNLNIPHTWCLVTKYAVPIVNRHIGIGKNRMASDPCQVF